MIDLVYTGPLARGTQTTQGRHVPFTRGVPVAFTAAEAAGLNRIDWQPATPAPGLTDGTVADVVARVRADPASVSAVLAAEQTGKARYSLLAALSVIEDQQADQATQPEET